MIYKYSIPTSKLLRPCTRLTLQSGQVFLRLVVGCQQVLPGSRVQDAPLLFTHHFLWIITVESGAPAASATPKTAAPVLHLSPAWSGNTSSILTCSLSLHVHNRFKLIRGLALSVADHLYLSAVKHWLYFKKKQFYLNVMQHREAFQIQCHIYSLLIKSLPSGLLWVFLLTFGSPQRKRDDEEP